MAYKDKEDERRNKREYYRRKMKDPEYREKYNQKKAEQARIRYANKYKKRRAETPWVFHYREAKKRCNNPNCKDYKYYGKRGIRMLLTLCEFEVLYKRDNANQMKEPSIDRIDGDGDYCFENCRFIEKLENSKRRHAKW